jgi:hypothetical protein
MTTTWTIDGVDAELAGGESDIPVLRPGADASLTFIFRPEKAGHVARYQQVRNIGASAPENPIVGVSKVTSRPYFVERTRVAAPRDEVVVKVTNDGDVAEDFWGYCTGYSDGSRDLGDDTAVPRRVTLDFTVIDVVRSNLQTKSELENEYSQTI